MKGKSVFTADKASEIRNILDECKEAGRYAKKDLRNSLRANYSFYISNYDRSRKGFTSKDFDHQVSVGNIEILG